MADRNAMDSEANGAPPAGILGVRSGARRRIAQLRAGRRRRGLPGPDGPAEPGRSSACAKTGAGSAGAGAAVPAAAAAPESAMIPAELPAGAGDGAPRPDAKPPPAPAVEPARTTAADCAGAPVAHDADAPDGCTGEPRVETDAPDGSTGEPRVETDATGLAVLAGWLGRGGKPGVQPDDRDQGADGGLGLVIAVFGSAARLQALGEALGRGERIVARAASGGVAAAASSPAESRKNERAPALAGPRQRAGQGGVSGNVV